MSLTNEQAKAMLSLLCPYCGASPGHWCRDFRGGLAVRIHKKRLAALEAAPVKA